MTKQALYFPGDELTSYNFAPLGRTASFLNINWVTAVVVDAAKTRGSLGSQTLFWLTRHWASSKQFSITYTAFPGLSYSNYSLLTRTDQMLAWNLTLHHAYLGEAGRGAKGRQAYVFLRVLPTQDCPSEGSNHVLQC